jgi:hypothetical protein
VWIDDRRPAPEGWTWVTTVTETIELLASGQVDELSLDHDLGLVDGDGREQTGYDVLLWIEEQVAVNGYTPPLLSVHSANSPAHERMLRAIESIERRAVR